MHYFLSRRADRLVIGTLNLPPGSSNRIPFGAVPTHGNQIMSCFVITRLQVNPPALNNRLVPQVYTYTSYNVSTIPSEEYDCYGTEPILCSE